MISNARRRGAAISPRFTPVMNFRSAPVLGGLSDRFGAGLSLIDVDRHAGDRLRDRWASRTQSGSPVRRPHPLGHFRLRYTLHRVRLHRRRHRTQRTRKGVWHAGAQRSVSASSLGPAIGGFLGQFDPRYPFFAAAGLAFVNFCYGLFAAAGVTLALEAPPPLRLETRQRVRRFQTSAEGAASRLASCWRWGSSILPTGSTPRRSTTSPASAMAGMKGMIGIALVACRRRLRRRPGRPHGHDHQALRPDQHRRLRLHNLCRRHSQPMPPPARRGWCSSSFRSARWWACSTQR